MTRTNKILLVALLVLLSAFVLTKVFRSPSLESNFNADVFNVDTASIAAVTITSNKDSDKPVTIRNTEEGWTVEQDGRTVSVARNQRDALLRTLAGMQAERIVSRKPEKWDTYQVGDSTSLEVVVLDKNEKAIAHWLIGKQSQGATYARLDGETEIYALRGYLQGEFNKSFADWRNKTFLDVNTAAVDKVVFGYPADSSFVLEKRDGWMIGDGKADSVKVEQYLGRLHSRNLSSFADNFSPDTAADVTLTISGNAMAPVIVKGWKADGSRWILTSSVQQDVYFDDSTFVGDLFIGKTELIK